MQSRDRVEALEGWNIDDRSGPALARIVPVRSDPLEPFLLGRSVRQADDPDLDGEAADVVVARYQLQDIPDYRAAIRRWFGAVAIGGHLVIVVPHAFLHGRQLALPSPWRRGQRRLYSPASLSGEVEEALTPNSYRVRWLGDLDGGYDYQLPPEVEPVGNADVAIVLERIAPPDWSVEREREPVSFERPPEPFAFEPVRTRVEVSRPVAPRRILILKLDHLGDFINAVPALERARAVFAGAEITLVVGAWNEAMARDLRVADRVIAFNAFPRNSSEEEPNVDATVGLFRSLVPEVYDLAIDLRADVDTRAILRAVSAPLKAGIGTRSRFPFLDIALPLDATRNEAERASELRITADRFTSQGSAKRGHFAIRSTDASVERDCAIVWGPFVGLNPGEYIFDFYLDLEGERGGLIKLDVALDHGRSVAERVVSRPQPYQLAFRVERPNTPFEARIWTVPNFPSIGFSFHGGLLIRKGPGDVLHQSEYQLLLIELVRIRLQETGLLFDAARP